MLWLVYNMGSLFHYTYDEPEKTKENIRRNGETRAAAFGRETVHSKYGRGAVGTNDSKIIGVVIMIMKI